VRFDVIAITKERDKWRIKHLKNAFYAWQWCFISNILC
jgi:hypothetical protein